MEEDIPDIRDNVRRVVGLFNGKLSTRDIQLIEYDKHMSMKELSEDMDININGIMYDIKNKEIYVTDDYVEGHETRTLKFLHEFEESRMFSRMTRMVSKFPEYKINYNKLCEENYQKHISTLNRSIFKDLKEAIKELSGVGKTTPRADGSFIKD